MTSYTTYALNTRDFYPALGEIRIVGPGKTRGYPYPGCKKRFVDTGETRGYPYPMCKKEKSQPEGKQLYFSHSELPIFK